MRVDAPWSEASRRMAQPADQAIDSVDGAQDSDDRADEWHQACQERMRLALQVAVARLGQVPHWRKRAVWR